MPVYHAFVNENAGHDNTTPTVSYGVSLSSPLFMSPDRHDAASFNEWLYSQMMSNLTYGLPINNELVSTPVSSGINQVLRPQAPPFVSQATVPTSNETIGHVGTSRVNGFLAQNAPPNWVTTPTAQAECDPFHQPSRRSLWNFPTINLLPQNQPPPLPNQPNNYHPNHPPPFNLFPQVPQQVPQQPLQVEGTQQLPTMRQMKLDFPTFGSGDPIHFLYRADQFFAIYRISEQHKVPIATMHLYDDAADLWHLFKSSIQPSWGAFCTLIIQQFSSQQVTDAQSALAKIKQEGTVGEYRSQFTRLCCRVTGFSPEALLACFVGGLKDPIRIDVRAMRPRTLMEAYEYARFYEERDNAHRGKLTPVSFTSRNNQASSSQQTYRVNRTSNTEATSVNKGSRLHLADYNERRKNNQFFFCDEQYKPGHNCKKAQVMMIEAAPFDSEDSHDNQFEEVADKTTLLLEGPEDEPLIQLHSISSDNKEKTDCMQLKGHIGTQAHVHRQVHVLIDSGASLNVVHPGVAACYKHMITQFVPIKVRMANGLVVSAMGIINLSVDLQRVPIQCQLLYIANNWKSSYFGHCMAENSW